MSYVIGAVVVVIVAAILIAKKSRDYRKIFNDDHYEEVAEWAKKVLDIYPVEESSLDNGTALQTNAGLAIAYTSRIDEGRRSVHFSISQTSGYTTGAVGGRFVFLLIRLLNKNKSEANLFRTDSSVHHAVFSLPQDQDWELETVANTLADMKKYQPPPISYINIAQQVDSEGTPHRAPPDF